MSTKISKSLSPKISQIFPDWNTVACVKVNEETLFLLFFLSFFLSLYIFLFFVDSFCVKKVWLNILTRIWINGIETRAAFFLLFDFQSRYGTVAAQDKCDVCSYPLVTRSFYYFPCSHVFHADCLIAEVTRNYLVFF